MDFAYELRIPKERIAVLIGTKGEIKKKIEELTHSTLEIDSQEGDVIITGDDSLNLYTAREVIRAIGRGFNPEIALLVLKPEYTFETIDMHDYGGKEKKDLTRLKSRIIGSDGKTRRFVENATDTYVVIYGKTIGIIGEIGRVAIAKQAMETLLMGSTHSTVYQWLDKKRKELRLSEVI